MGVDRNFESQESKTKKGKKNCCAIREPHPQPNERHLLGILKRIELVK